MRQKSVPVNELATQVLKNVRRATRRHFSAKDKIRIVLEGLRGEDSIAELCRREGIVRNLYYRWSKDFLEAGKRELAVRFTDTEGYFVSEASVYRLLKAHDLISSPAFIMMKAAGEVKDRATAPNQLSHTDFPYLHVIPCGWVS